MENRTIKNIILDLGGVLFDIDPKRSQRAFEQILKPEFKIDEHWGELLPIVHDMEVGAMTNEAFFERVQKLTIPGTSIEAIRHAWCTMLIGFPQKRLELVSQLARRYNLYVLSNTNALHVDYFEDLFQKTHGFDFRTQFKHVFYSSDIGRRKPHAEAFQHVVEIAGLKTHETVMVDDLPENCQAAESIGLQSVRVPAETGLEAVMDQLI